MAWESSMSGPFGADLPPGHWVGLVDIIRQSLEFQKAMRARRERGEEPGWFDIHAMLGSTGTGAIA